MLRQEEARFNNPDENTGAPCRKQWFLKPELGEELEVIPISESSRARTRWGQDKNMNTR